MVRIWNGGTTSKVKIQLSDDQQSVLVNARPLLLTSDVDSVRVRCLSRVA